MPQDVPQPLVEGLAALLRSRDYVVDWWEGDPRPREGQGDSVISEVYFPRPAHVVWGNWPLDAPSDWSTQYQCVFLGPAGCALPDRDRPAVCRALEPRDAGEGGCKGHLNKRHLALAWLPLQEEIIRAVDLADPDPDRAERMRQHAGR